MEYEIRNARPTDIDDIINLCAAHAAHEQAGYSSDGKSENLSRELFSSHPKLRCLVAETANGVVGYATFTKDYSTWDAAEFAYLDCLFLRPEARNFGIGEALIREIAKIALSENCLLMQWHTPPFNTRAIKFYRRIGATSKEKVRFYLDENTLKQLAS